MTSTSKIILSPLWPQIIRCYRIKQLFQLYYSSECLSVTKEKSFRKNGQLEKIFLSIIHFSHSWIIINKIYGSQDNLNYQLIYDILRDQNLILIFKHQIIIVQRNKRGVSASSREQLNLCLNQIIAVVSFLLMIGIHKKILFLLYYEFQDKISKSKIIIYQMQTYQHSLQSSQDANDLQQHSFSDLSSINEVQLQNTIKTLHKIKKIQQRGQLTQFKTNNKAGKQIFKEMSSYFFVNRQKKKIRKRQLVKQGKLTKQQRVQNNKVRKQNQVSTCKIKRIRFRSTKNQMKKLNQHIQHNLKGQEGSQSFEPTSGTSGDKCHICRIDYQHSHHFYRFLCPTCGQLNFIKRNQKADLAGLTALVTGGRIKIGYQIALKLLRDGAKVYVTSRFANDTLLRYAKEQDYQEWKGNLYILQCDFLSQKQVDQLIRYVKQNVTKLDILINNAAQTIVRPKQFYTIEIDNQKLALQYPNPISSNQLTPSLQNNQVTQFPSLYSNNLLIKSDEIDLTRLDQFGQPTDKRPSNSWVQRIQEVSLLDCYTTQVINSIVPFHLISQLRQKMKGETPSWVINVSSMEGVFYRPGKQQYHPHTNMAKAALNMITRTCAHQFLRDGIYMNSVDTGWVTNQNPLLLAQKMKDKYRFQCPLDCVDGAMRVLDPIYLGLLHRQFPTGQFLKNYASSFW